jgi:mono/diheme cytochrome c family protein
LKAVATDRPVGSLERKDAVPMPAIRGVTMRLAPPATFRVAAVIVAASAIVGSAVIGASAGGAFQDPRVPPNQNAPTFTKDVAPILYNKCVTCHRPGEVAPMSLITYQDVRPWARSIQERVAARVMPPWFADPAYGHFRNARTLTEQEIDTITRWAGGGARQGNPADLPRLPQFPNGWQIGTPDVVFEMAADYRIPADGTIDYQYFEVPTNFKEDRWMQAGEVRAGDSEHVHHIIVSVIEPELIRRPNVMTIRPIVAAGETASPRAPRALTAEQRAQLAQVSRRAGAVMLVNWAVGEDAPIYQPGMAKRIPAGSTLLFQVHYTTNGAPGQDRSKVGFIFSKEPPPKEIRTGAIANAQFAIPPGVADHQVESEASFSDDVKVWSLHPHMHMRGKDMTYTAIYPDGRREIVLRVPKYDFGWQTDYWLAEPLALPKGSKLLVTAHFDNSAANRNNPNPKETVRWGDQTWEEMMIGFMTYTVEGRTPPATAGNH